MAMEMAAGATGRQVIGLKEQTAVLGGVLWLCRYSRLHQQYTVAELLNSVAVSVELNQYRYYEDAHGTPVGFCNWAFLSDELLALALKGDLWFRPEHWRSGSNVFIPELLAPFGHCRAVARDLRQNILPRNGRFWSIRSLAAKDGEEGTPRVRRLRNVCFHDA